MIWNWKFCCAWFQVTQGQDVSTSDSTKSITSIPLTSPSPAKGHCIWYGQCSNAGGKVKNCPYTGPAKPLNPSSANTLKKWCPHLFPENSDAPSKFICFFMECRFDYNSKFVSVNTCCDEKQVASLDVNLGMASGFIKRCPSCLQNFVRHFCEMTCASNQSDFLVVKGIDKDKSKFIVRSTTKLLIFPFFFRNKFVVYHRSRLAHHD